MKKIAWLFILFCLSLLILVGCNKKEEFAKIRYFTSNGEDTYEYVIESPTTYTYTHTWINGYAKVVTTNKGTYTNNGEIYIRTSQSEHVDEYYLDFSTPINSYDVDVSYEEKHYEEILTDKIICIDDGERGVALNGDSGVSAHSIVCIYNKHKLNNVDAKVALNATKEDVAKALSLSIMYGDLYSIDIKLSAMNIGNIDTSSTGKKNVSITYFGKPYNAVIDVVEVGLEKIIDAKNIKSVVARGTTAREYIRDQKIIYDGQEISMTSDMISNYNTNDLGVTTFTITYRNVSTTKTIKVYDPNDDIPYIRIVGVELADDVTMYCPVNTRNTPVNVTDYIKKVFILKNDGTTQSFDYNPRSGFSTTEINNKEVGPCNVTITYTYSNKEFKYTIPFYFYDPTVTNEIITTTSLNYLPGETCAYVKNGTLQLKNGSDSVVYQTTTAGQRPKSVVVKETMISNFGTDRITSDGQYFVIPIETTNRYGNYTFYEHIHVKLYTEA